MRALIRWLVIVATAGVAGPTLVGSAAREAAAAAPGAVTLEVCGGAVGSPFARTYRFTFTASEPVTVAAVEQAFPLRNGVSYRRHTAQTGATLKSEATVQTGQSAWNGRSYNGTYGVNPRSWFRVSFADGAYVDTVPIREATPVGRQPDCTWSG